MTGRTNAVVGGESVELVSGSIAYSGYATVDGAVVELNGGEVFQTPLHSIVIALPAGPSYNETVNMRYVAYEGTAIYPVNVLEVTGDNFYFR